MKRWLGVVPLTALLLTGCTDLPGRSDGAGAVGPPADSAAARAPSALAVIAAERALAQAATWPGFQPDTIPLALYDGRGSFLTGFEDAPEGFEPLERDSTVFVHDGRHPALRANAPTTIAGRRVAGLLVANMAGASPEQAAATALHEKFHVFQAERHPDWAANELALFSYPVDDLRQLFRRRLETTALASALEAVDRDDAACWLNTALILRQRRMRSLTEASIAYERELERTEGLARYVEWQVRGGSEPIAIAAQGYAPEDVRGRAYDTGAALAVLLDRLDPGWQERMEEDPVPLDSALTRALAERPTSTCGFSAAERQRVLERARAAVDVMRARQESALHELTDRPGWSVRFVVEDGQPLWPQSFDPMSIQQVGAGRLLHARMIRLGNEFGTIDVYDRPALTRGTSDDPLGSGVRELLVTGFDERPGVQSAGGDTVRLRAPGLSAELAPARVTGSATAGGGELIVRVP